MTSHATPKIAIFSRKKIRTNKSLGQHFLKDQNIVHKIIQACHFKTEETVLEIGSGSGILTRAIAPNVKQLLSVETDKNLAEKLQKEFLNTHVEIRHNDILKLDFTSLPTPLKVVGNLPYYISSPILEKLIQNKTQISDIFIMVQLEFGQRMVAKPHTRDYSPLSLFVQYHTIPEILFTIKPNVFNPPPKVESCFVHLKIKTTGDLIPKDEKVLFEIIHKVFQQRRKTILNSLSSFYGQQASSLNKSKMAEILSGLRINPQSRPENLSLDQFVNLSNAILSHK